MLLIYLYHNARFSTADDSPDDTMYPYQQLLFSIQMMNIQCADVITKLIGKYMQALSDCMGNNNAVELVSLHDWRELKICGFKSPNICSILNIF